MIMTILFDDGDEDWISNIQIYVQYLWALVSISFYLTLVPIKKTWYRTCIWIKFETINCSFEFNSNPEFRFQFWSTTYFVQRKNIFLYIQTTFLGPKKYLFVFIAIFRRFKAKTKRKHVWKQKKNDAVSQWKHFLLKMEDLT